MKTICRHRQKGIIAWGERKVPLDDDHNIKCVPLFYCSILLFISLTVL
jgi:hypothetical protein